MSLAWRAAARKRSRVEPLRAAHARLEFVVDPELQVVQSRHG